ncbi:MAG: purine-nucleoside phosphorylase [Syntrophobacteraceae bacterium]
MEELCEQVEDARAFIRSRIEVSPKIALVLGTGLGDVSEAMGETVVIPYDQIPHFPTSTAPGHSGQLTLGLWGAQPTVIMKGRFHLYEGYTAKQVAFPIRIIAAMGVKILIVCSASGGLNPRFRAGDLMLVTDHINMTGHNPLIGPNVDEWGPRFPDMTEPYSRRLQEIAFSSASAQKLLLHRGVYAGVLGPSLETAAETRFLRAIGADTVGMSMVTEVITAVHAGIDVLGFSVITNVNLPDNYQSVSVDEIVATAAQASPRLMQLISGLMPKL